MVWRDAQGTYLAPFLPNVVAMGTAATALYVDEAGNFWGVDPFRAKVGPIIFLGRNLVSPAGGLAAGPVPLHARVASRPAHGVVSSLR